jgi:predicted transposase YbfD/YdcC
MFGEEQLDWLRRFLPFRHGVAPAQTLRRVLRALDPKALERAFSGWVASLKAKVSGVVAIDGKTLRGTKPDRSGTGALHVVLSLCARGRSRAGRPGGRKQGQRDHRQKGRLPPRAEGEPGLPLRRRRGAVRRSGARFDLRGMPADRSRAWTNRGAPGPRRRRGLARRAASALDGLALHRRDQRNTDRQEDRRDLDRDAALYLFPAVRSGLLLKACRSHWSIENNLHWRLDVTFREDECRIRKDYAAINLARMRHAAINILNRDPSKSPSSENVSKPPSTPSSEPHCSHVNDS